MEALSGRDSLRRSPRLCMHLALCNIELHIGTCQLLQPSTACLPVSRLGWEVLRTRSHRCHHHHPISTASV